MPSTRDVLKIQRYKYIEGKRMGKMYHVHSDSKKAQVSIRQNRL